MRMNAVKAVKRLEGGRDFQLVVAGGLFDYVPDKFMVAILQSIFQGILSGGGICLFTNIGRGKIFRPSMDYAAAWNLIERSPEEII